jgi:glycosyltransferase involved in cell wall biosynthesis
MMIIQNQPTSRTMPNPCRILMLVAQLPLDPHRITGGVHSAVINLLSGFRQQPIQLRVVSFSQEVTEVTVVRFADHIEIVYEPEGSWPFHSLNYLFNGRKILKHHIADFKPDLIHYQNGNTVLFAGLGVTGQIPVLLTIHGTSWDDMRFKKTIREKITWWFNGWINQRLLPKHLIVLSTIAKNRQPLTSLHAIEIIPNALNPAFFQLPMKSQTNNRLLFIGVINDRRNLMLILDAVQQLRNLGKNYTLDVLGGFDNAFYEQQIKKRLADDAMESYVTLHGWSDQQKVREYLAASDILVMASKIETLPMVIAEAQAAGTVVVSSTVGGIPAMIQHGQNGFMYSLDEPTQLTEILSSLYNEYDRLHAMAQIARKHAIQQYESNTVAQKTVLFYDKIIHNNKQR